MEVTNRFKGLDLRECLNTMDGGSQHCTGGSDQDHPQEKETQMKKAKWLSEEALQIAEKRREAKDKGEK